MTLPGPAVKTAGRGRLRTGWAAAKGAVRARPRRALGRQASVRARRWGGPGPRTAPLADERWLSPSRGSKSAGGIVVAAVG